MMVPVQWVIAAAIVVGLIWLLSHLMQRWVDDLKVSAGRISASIEAATKAVESMEKATHRLHDLLAPAVEEIRANLPIVPKLLDSVAKVGEAQLEATQKQRAVEAERQRNPFGRPNITAQRDQGASELEHDVTQMMRAEAITREEALLRLNGANQRTVWEGDPFNGWGR